MIEKFLKFVVRMKVYMTRSMGYIGMINSAMILFLLMSNLEKYGIDLNIREYLVPIVVFSVILMLLWGYLEDRLGLWQYEQAVSQDRSKFSQTTKESLQRIEMKLDKLLATKK